MLFETLKPLVDRYSEGKSDEPERLNQSLFEQPRSGSLALRRDLHDLWLWAPVLAIALNMGFGLILHASHPLAAAT